MDASSIAEGLDLETYKFMILEIAEKIDFSDHMQIVVAFHLDCVQCAFCKKDSDLLNYSSQEIRENDFNSVWLKKSSEYLKSQGWSVLAVNDNNKVSVQVICDLCVHQIE